MTTIEVDGKNIDFQLEHEETLGDVISELQGWLSQGRAFIAGLSVDDEALLAGDRLAWEARPLSSIGTVKVRTSSFVQERIDALAVIAEYFQLAARACHEGTDDELAAILTEWPNVRAGISDSLSASLGAGAESWSRVDEQVREVQAKPGDVVARSRLGRTVDGVALIAVDRVREQLEPRGEARAAAATLGRIRPEVESVSVRMQTGEGREAVASLLRFIELTAKVIRVTEALDTDATLSDRVSTLAGQLRELEEGIENQDSVVIGDLLEYDLLPAVEDILVELQADE